MPGPRGPRDHKGHPDERPANEPNKFRVIFSFEDHSEAGQKYKLNKGQHLGLRPANVITINIKATPNSNVGNGHIYPNLDIVANNLLGAFVKQDGTTQLDLSALRVNLGNGLDSIGMPTASFPDKIEISSIGLEGFGRGAIAAWATAKQLNALDIPMHVMAVQPVPGVINEHSELVERYRDLSQCHKIEAATTLLGNYDRRNGFIENVFGKQMCANFSDQTTVNNTILPFQNAQALVSQDPVYKQLASFLSTHGYCHISTADEQLHNWYIHNKQFGYTPTEVTQTIFNSAEKTINKDLFYLKHIKDTAITILQQNQIFHEDLTEDQASAVYYINELHKDKENSDGDKFQRGRLKVYLTLVVTNTEQAIKFRSIVNKVSETCAYLTQTMADKNSKNYHKEKAEAIKTHTFHYKANVFAKSYNFLHEDNVTLQRKIEFAQDIYKDEVTFRKNALGNDRNAWRIVLRFLTNFITHVSVIGLGVNIYNKVTTGNWLLFEHNRSEQTVRDARKKLLSDLDVPTPPQNGPGNDGGGVG